MKTLIALTALNIAVSGTTLAIVLVAGKKGMARMQQIEQQAQDYKRKFKKALADLDF